MLTDDEPLKIMRELVVCGDFFLHVNDKLTLSKSIMLSQRQSKPP
jgi:hypothetical protein